MLSKVIVLQVLLMCYTSVCSEYSCSSDGDGDSGPCGMALNEDNLDEAVEKMVAKVRELIPEAEDVASEDCEFECFNSEEPGDGGEWTLSAQVNDSVGIIDELVKELEKPPNKPPSIEHLKGNVEDFLKDRDWPTLQEALQATLKPGDPALEQANAVEWTDGKDALMDAVYSGHVDLLRVLLDLGVDANVPWGPNNSSMLHAAAAAGNTEVAELLFSRGAEVDNRADWRVTPLLRAAASHQPAMVQWLLEHNADVSASDTQGWTALHHAARANDLDSVKLLLAWGAPRDALNENNNTARDEAAVFGYSDIADLL